MVLSIRLFYYLSLNEHKWIGSIPCGHRDPKCFEPYIHQTDAVLFIKIVEHQVWLFSVIHPTHGKTFAKINAAPPTWN